MTLEKLARMTQGEFVAIRKDMGKLATKDDLKNFATKDDLRSFATKEDVRELKHEIIEEVRNENQKVIHSNDKVVTKLDVVLKELGAHGAAHERIDQKLEDHEKRIKRVEVTAKLAD